MSPNKLLSAAFPSLLGVSAWSSDHWFPVNRVEVTAPQAAQRCSSAAVWFGVRLPVIPLACVASRALCATAQTPYQPSASPYVACSLSVYCLCWNHQCLHWWWIPTYIRRQPVMPPHPSSCHTEESPIRAKQLSVALSSFVWDDWADHHWFLINRTKRLPP